MLNLVIDTGNSSSKVALFKNRTIIRSSVFQVLDEPVLKQFIGDVQLENAISSSVSNRLEGINSYLGREFNYIRFHTGLDTGVKIQYKTPETLGPDRLAAVIGALALYPGEDLLVLDAGTCITYDLADRARNYYGGSISPGIKMRFQAMHELTGRLPLVELDFEFRDTWGNDTRTAILSGVQQGVLNEATGFIGLAKAQYPELRVLLCGGDVNFFESHLKISIFARALKTEPDLVLIGLNEVILNTND